MIYKITTYGNYAPVGSGKEEWKFPSVYTTDNKKKYDTELKKKVTYYTRLNKQMNMNFKLILEEQHFSLCNCCAQPLNNGGAWVFVKEIRI